MSGPMKEMLHRQWPLLLVPIAIAFDFFWVGQAWYSPLVIYGLFIRYLIQTSLSKAKRRVIFYTLGIAAAVIFVAGYYVNYYMPHGPMIDGLEEFYAEDMRNLNIPDWAKFLRSHDVALFFALAFAAVVAHKDNKYE